MRSLVPGICAVALLLGAVPSAVARPPVAPDKRPPAAKVQGSNGFTIYVFGTTQTTRTSVTLMARRGRNWTSYQAPGNVRPNSIVARFDDLGRVDLEFDPNGTVRDQAQVGGCGETLAVRLGEWSGEIEFRAEGGFTRVSAKRAKATAPPSRVGCGRVPSFNPQGALLEGGRNSKKNPLGLTVTKASPDAPAELNARANGRRGKLLILRRLTMVAPASSFVYDSDSAFLKPPAPFSGSAQFLNSYTVCDSTTTASGSLFVSFPGKRRVPMTGRGFQHELGVPHQYPPSSPGGPVCPL